LESLLESVGEGLRTDSGGFKPRAWSKAYEAVNKAADSYRDDTDQIEGYKILKKDWNNWILMMTQSGWEEEDGLPIVDPEAMETYFREHREMCKFRYKPLLY
jgi:hypothetical protein